MAEGLGAILVDERLHQLDAVAAVFAYPADPEVAHAVDTETVSPATVVTFDEDLTVLRAGDGTLHAVPDIPLVSGTEILVCIHAESVAIYTYRSIDHTDGPSNRLLPTITTITTITDDRPLPRMGSMWGSR